MWRKTVGLCALLLLLSACKQEEVAVGEVAPQLAAYDLQGKPVALEQWKGKQVYLNFWSASCGGCLAEMAALDKLSQQYQQDIVVVAINTDPEQVDIAPVLAQRNISYPVIRDQLGITQERYQVIGTPTSFMIDRHGKVTELHQGARDEKALTTLFQQWAAGA
ncbi:TlpA family protein disulfide reductase [Yersinia enterocolitica]|uniref:TlpA family protein disulfide reductase n=1 Tax=Yersinia enterocolitica TaxID=630 RepID=UPI001C60F493|nr:TlpA disulfide reductase family protein [Yersinia enterocolitica]EKN3683596.1 TlpA family protein disulfide reductase [Yersinia enterocolitica]EKN4189579.1 TlpA family protein disulfide reductase [Yersinia enterocolitica]ELI7904659.1 TlpA family protein disulfide reductase [Yersinia enterocolitica]ELI7917524.1 TlpA family protein disulfide reductase [Yersinia enterocolitica]ELI8322887.1 TlpA family protein disulfide reductase [Yersinia enterocolitica]